MRTTGPGFTSFVVVGVALFAATPLTVFAQTSMSARQASGQDCGSPQCLRTCDAIAPKSNGDGASSKGQSDAKASGAPWTNYNIRYTATWKVIGTAPVVTVEYSVTPRIEAVGNTATSSSVVLNLVDVRSEEIPGESPDNPNPLKGGIATVKHLPATFLPITLTAGAAPAPAAARSPAPQQWAVASLATPVVWHVASIPWASRPDLYIQSEDGRQCPVDFPLKPKTAPKLNASGARQVPAGPAAKN